MLSVNILYLSKQSISITEWLIDGSERTVNIGPSGSQQFALLIGPASITSSNYTQIEFIDDPEVHFISCACLTAILWKEISIPHSSFLDAVGGGRGGQEISDPSLPTTILKS
ncbi:hypothetical protein TNIN_57881 [Trichonephila inaurata madagascariensis]|uniref:Uncharacterized protein n=1 Tax=Trichonephila inaurata madagascariensis TaxID=2747483 RepID=A0A8X6YQX0_9ARAC|nr:hypothetical protein TNIN_57881 [Trichonephila inaurata madagascariensis]